MVNGLIRQKQRSPSPVGPPKPKGKRAMDSFLEEIKRSVLDRLKVLWTQLMRAVIRISGKLGWGVLPNVCPLDITCTPARR